MQDDFVLGGKCPGRIVKITRRKISWEFFVMGGKSDWIKISGRKIREEIVAGGKFLGGFCNSVQIDKVKKMYRKEYKQDQRPALVTERGPGGR